MKKIFSLAFLISFIFLLSCANSHEAKHSDIKEANVSDTTQAAVKQDNALSSRIVLSGKATILIPEGFELMDAKMLAAKYPQTGHQPTEVYTNEGGTINIALNYTQNKTEEKDLEAVKKTMESQFNQPNIEFIQSSMQEINGPKYIQLEFVTPAEDSKIYNLLQITSLEERLAMVTFNCTENYRKDWETTAKEIMQSIEIK